MKVLETQEAELAMAEVEMTAEKQLPRPTCQALTCPALTVNLAPPDKHG